MAVLTKDAILQADDLPRELVSVPEWGGDVYVRTMTGTERDAWELGITEGDRSNIRASFAACVCCGDDGALLFALADVVALGAKSSAALDRIFAVGRTLNGLSDDDVDALEKNSDETGDDSSPTA